MNQLTREKALEILELSPDATKDEVSKRYSILTRKFKTLEKDERGYTLNDITDAYNLLMGITYVDKEEEERQKRLRENPPLLARILRVDPIKLENFFHYYKIHMLVGLAVIVILFFSIRSCINRVDPDFTIVCYGNIFAADQTAVEENVKERVPGITTPSVQFLATVSDDPQYVYASQMKFVAMIAAKEIDIIIMDRENFDINASQGIFLSLDELADELGFPEESYMRGSEIIDETEDGNVIKGPEQIYGIDITGSEFIKNNNIHAESAIVAIARNTQRMDSALEFIRSLGN
ncbi:hypothetical protein CSTERLE_12075 [Thermoclostridium stercorarium subsp. leptospartum DSM 9219]|jgi:hypothetical protein|uniref:J domain-containing protein n=1 Tax=Thermoclostridium stercorarium subsp. leptospartum DSM 9219 TaxID=1346611 RepID=A0A1B1YN89_THEST|nr:hypothetical protein [Thermoclostridium stercorarium]ANX02255.1 hypothetical protein CSTERLE_12075 [Thermoclostridium stercorarium subsp. leptospartum DSM 9219]